MGLQMVRDAHDSLQGEDTFLALKRQKAAEALKNQWQESIKSKKTAKDIGKIFD